MELRTYSISEADKKKEQLAWKKFEKLDTLWAEGTMPWRSLACIGYPNYICYEDGSVYKVEPERLDSDGKVFTKIRTHLVGNSKRYKVNVSTRVRTGGVWRTLTEGLLVHMLVALLFLEKPEGSRQVGFIDGDQYNVHASNLYWK